MESTSKKDLKGRGKRIQKKGRGRPKPRNSVKKGPKKKKEAQHKQKNVQNRANANKRKGSPIEEPEAKRRKGTAHERVFGTKVEFICSSLNFSLLLILSLHEERRNLRFEIYRTSFVGLWRMELRLYPG